MRTPADPGPLFTYDPVKGSSPPSPRTLLGARSRPSRPTGNKTQQQQIADSLAANPQAAGSHGSLFDLPG
jgi:hypothetical protein